MLPDGDKFKSAARTQPRGFRIRGRDHSAELQGLLLTLSDTHSPVSLMGRPAILVGTPELMGKDITLRDQDAGDVPPGVNSPSPQPPRENGGL